MQSGRFESGDVELAGTLRIPTAGAQGGAVALVHGSGPQTRDGPFGGYLRAIAEWFAASGVVALTYDKRGCGESSGEWETASFEDLAPTRRPPSICFAASTESTASPSGAAARRGSILPLVAAQRELATVIVVSGAGCGITPSEQDL